MRHLLFYTEDEADKAIEKFPGSIKDLWILINIIDSVASTIDYLLLARRCQRSLQKMVWDSLEIGGGPGASSRDKWLCLRNITTATETADTG